MPTKTAQRSGRGNLVRCRMVNEEIPEDLCRQEQGSDLCRGCLASSRRCTGCGKTRMLVDAQNGLCEACSEGNDSSEHEKEPSPTIATALDRIRAIVAAPVMCNQPAEVDSRGDPGKPPASPLLKDPAALYPVLMEHGIERENVWSVNAPIHILMRRFHLLREEAAHVLEALAKKKYLEGGPPWGRVVLQRTDGIERVRMQLEHPRSELTEKVIPTDLQQSRRPRHQTVSSRAPTKALKARPLDLKPTRSAVSAECRSHPPIKTVTPRPSSTKPTVTYRILFADLVSRSKEVRGERLVGGALPALQIRFKLSVDEAKETLEWFESHGHIERKDEWRTIILRSESVDSEEGPSKPTQDKGSAHQERHHVDRRPHVRGASPSASAASKKIAHPGAGPLATAIAELEHTLPVLREKRDALARHVAELEAAYATLTAFQRSLAQTQHIADSALAEAMRTTQSILSSLKRN